MVGRREGRPQIEGSSGDGGRGGRRSWGWVVGACAPARYHPSALQAAPRATRASPLLLLSATRARCCSPRLTAPCTPCSCTARAGRALSHTL